MIKHGISHGIAVLTCTLTSGILLKISYDSYPRLIRGLDSLGVQMADNLGLVMSGRTIVTLLLAFVLAILWGVAFACVNSTD